MLASSCPLFSMHPGIDAVRGPSINNVVVAPIVLRVTFKRGKEEGYSVRVGLLLRL